MRCVVTGGAGFIGSHLCEHLLKQHEVACVDNLITSSAGNVSHLLKNPSFSFLQHDITVPLDVRADAIFHLASPASPVDYAAHAVETLMVNSLGTFNALELARKNKALFLLASTSEAYGDPKEHPQRETYWGNVNPTGTRSQYDEAKRFAEALTMAYMRKHNVDVRIVRIFNTFGPFMRLNDGRVVPNFIKQALAGEPLTVYGTGEQTRSFCYVSDMVEGICAAMFSPATKGEVFNLGNTEEMRIIDFAKLIKQMGGTASPITFKPLPQDDPEKRRPDISKAERVLNWKPRVALREGLALTMEWFKKQQR
jgi:nucleoside-diphosphate-sugar epimerase